MKFTGQYKYLALMAGVAGTLAVGAEQVSAQTVTVDVDLQVQNTLTLTVAENLNFGKIVAIHHATKVASLTIDPIAGLEAPTTTGAGALIAVVDNSNVKVAQIEIEDGADTATINVTIQNVINPTDGTTPFTLDTFETSYNGGAATGRTAATPFTQTFDASFGGGKNTMDIGAKISTGTAAYANGNYDGGFDVVFSY